MNWLGFAAVFLGFTAYLLGLHCARKSIRPPWTILIALVAMLLAVPAVVYAVYYSKVLGEPIWLYRVRVMTGSEFFGSFAGFTAGWVQVRMVPHSQLSMAGKRFLVPVSLVFTLALPHLKPLLRPLRANTLREAWKGEACLQSTVSTCGPASAATIVRRLGGNVSERDLAGESFTCRSGTENWYLARALRRHGFETSFILGHPATVHLPAIAGVRLRSLGNSGHFIALLDRRADKFVIADPMEGLSTNSLADLEGSYEFTGFFLVVRPDHSSQ